MSRGSKKRERSWRERERCDRRQPTLSGSDMQLPLDPWDFTYQCFFTILSISSRWKKQPTGRETLDLIYLQCEHMGPVGLKVCM